MWRTSAAAAGAQPSERLEHSSGAAASSRSSNKRARTLSHWQQQQQGGILCVNALEDLQCLLPLASLVACADGCVGDGGVGPHSHGIQGLIQLQGLGPVALSGHLAHKLGQACAGGAGVNEKRQQEVKPEV